MLEFVHCHISFALSVPLLILFSCGSYEVISVFDKEKHQKDGPIYYYVFNTLLFCLLVLNIYWWVLMLRMLADQIRAKGKVSEDIRSDSEDDDDYNDHEE
ncbi:hypothetical protein Ahy_B05g076648 isoform B [Arachis hypogaea]|nr:hypothetical protein Ahy_B05g076648 isoform B [Arachis hypogaea]